MKTIVTGAAGFIGSHIAERLLNAGASVVAIDNLSRPGNVGNLDFLRSVERGRLTFYHADIRSQTDIDSIFFAHRDTEVVIHQAGQVAVTTSVKDPRLDFEANAFGTFNVLDAARKYAPDSIFLYASTNKVYGGLEHVRVEEQHGRYAYGDRPHGISETEPIDFHSPYGCSKGAAEQYVRDYHRIYGLRTVVFRQSCIFGTRQFGMEDQGWVAWFTIAALLKRPITIFGDGKQVRDLLWIDDLVDLYLCALERIQQAAGNIYNAGGGPANTLSLLELVALLERQIGAPLPYTTAGWRPGDQRIFTADCARATRELGWTPRVSPAEGVARLVDWVRENPARIEAALKRV